MADSLSTNDLKNVARVEVLDWAARTRGRAYVKSDVQQIKLELVDGKRTLKVHLK